MSYRLAVMVSACSAGLLLAVVSGAQSGPPRPGSAGYMVLNPDKSPFNPRDLNGIWTRGHPDGGMGGEDSCVGQVSHSGPCGDRGYSQEWPEFTPAGLAAFEANRPSYGRPLGSEDAAAHPEEHIGRRRAVPAGEGNDPEGTCNPLGLIRALFFPTEWEMVMVKDRILQQFSQTNAWRSIWMDGRKLPPIEELQAPLWYGYSVGRWEGDTLVVETIGQDSRVWIDHFGYPISDEARIEERYRRTYANVMELSITLTDPKYYAKPWKSQKKKLLWRPKDYFRNSNWPGMYYDDCAPVDEVDNFKALIVNPAAPGYVGNLTPDVNVKELMKWVVVPASDALWKADKPEDQDDWARLESAAFTMLAASASLNLGGSGPQDKEWAKQPEWRQFTRSMSKASVASLEAIRNKDVEALRSAGKDLDTPCQECHKKFYPAIFTQ